MIIFKKILAMAPIFLQLPMISLEYKAANIHAAITFIARRISLYPYLGCLIVSLVFTSEVFGQFEELTTKTFAVHYRSIDEFIPLTQALISNKGTITPNATMNVMVVQDYPTNLKRVDSLLLSYDLPLQQMRITIQLVQGSTVTDQDKILSNPEVERLVGDNFKFNRLELIDKGIIITEETSSTTFDLANGTFAISFLTVYLPLEVPKIELRNFTLTSVRRALGGEQRKLLLGTSFAMEDGEEQIVGAMKIGLADETLLVILRMEILG